MNRTKNAVALALAAGLAAAPLHSAAAAALIKGDFAGKTHSEIRDELTRQGYRVQKVERDDGFLEAYAEMDGQVFEIYVDPITGKILKVDLEH